MSTFLDPEETTETETEEIERERDTERERQSDRVTEGDRQTETDREKEGDSKRDRVEMKYDNFEDPTYYTGWEWIF